MATYRIGPNDYFTPSDLQADADTLASQVAALDAVWSNVPGGKLNDVDDSWIVFTSQWNAFYRNVFGGGSIGDFLAALNNSNRDQLIQFEQRFDRLRLLMRDQGIFTEVADSVKPKDPGGFGGVLTWVGVILGLVLAIILLRPRT